jgi:acetolactate synthase I/II/III large subunit
MHTGNILVEELKAHGVTHVFGLPGEQTLPLYDALDEEPSIRHVGMRDERNLPYAALAYSRVAGRVGVLDVTVGPGTAMLPLGMLEALRSTTPMVAIVSDVPVEFQHMADVGAISQGMDQTQFLAPITKWRSKAWTQDQVSALVRRAFQEAASGAPGPAAVIIPQDIFEQESDGSVDSGGARPDGSTYPRHRSVPDSAALQAAADLLLQAHRPVVVAGGGVLHSNATEELLVLSEHLELPVGTTLTGKGSFAEDHPLALGVLGSLGSVAAQKAAQAADLVVLVGFRSAQNSTFKWTLPSPDQKVIHIDIDPEQPGRFLRCDVALVGDARATMAALLEVVRRRGGAERRPDWRGRVDEWKQEWEEQVAAESTSDEVPILPQRVVAELVGTSEPDDVVVSDASFSSGWAAVYYRVRQRGRRVVLPRGMAGLGFGLPAGIGAKAASPDRNVFVLAGDGGFAYSLGELITLKEHGLKLISVVLNNRSWGWMEWVAKLNYGREYFALPDVPFARVAEALGLRGVRVGRAEDLKPALIEAIEAPESAVIEVESAVWEAPIPAYREALAEMQQREHAGAFAGNLGG